jgi:hypothetical protein
MQASGVEHVRPVVYWADAQPHKPGSALPSGWTMGRNNVPTDFHRTDRIFAEAARQGISVLPVVLRAPRWDLTNKRLYASPPKRNRHYANFMGTLVDRYGPGGSFWAENPDVPRREQRDWQIWNEPNIDRYWASPHPFAKRYVRLLRAARKTIKQADPGARIFLTGFANYSWRALKQAYKAGARGLFDVAAVHPFSGRLKFVLKIVRYNRDVMRRAGDARRPIAITELTWPSSKGKTRNTAGWETTEEGQAVRLRKAFRAFYARRQRWRIERLTWSTWLTPDRGSPNSFDWSGLRKLDPRNPAGEPKDKPALRAFRAVVLPLNGK